MMPKVYILYENEEWMPPLRRELKRAGLPYDEWFTHKGHFDLSEEPPKGIFLNRISPSSHTRNHEESISLTKELLVWLESHGRRVINGSQAFALETSKIRQYEALKIVGVKTPHTIIVSGGPGELQKAGSSIKLPFLTKHNCGGKGLGIRLFRSFGEFERYLDSSLYQHPVDSIWLLQEYIEAPKPYITRVEIVDGKFLYAIYADTTQGFELCPADTCEVKENRTLPTGEDEIDEVDRQSLFSLREDFDDPIVNKYIEYMRMNKVDVAGFEFIEKSSGEMITYDVNGTTNYSPSVEERHGLNGMAAIVNLLSRELKEYENTQT